MNVGYARVSTDAQDHTSQLAALNEAGCKSIFVVLQPRTGILLRRRFRFGSTNNAKAQDG
jgi:DNA invertase Pin-like site-specific DNA recombinase